MQASAGTESLRYGLSAASLVTLVGAGVLVATSFSLQRTMDRRATASSPDALVTACSPLPSECVGLWRQRGECGLGSLGAGKPLRPSTARIRCNVPGFLA